MANIRRHKPASTLLALKHVLVHNLTRNRPVVEESILDRILTFVPNHRKKRLRLTCKALNEAVNPKLFSTIYISFTSPRISQAFRLLKALDESTTSISEHVKDLRIGFEWIVGQVVDRGETAKNPNLLDPDSFPIMKHIEPAMMTLRALERVSFQVFPLSPAQKANFFPTVKYIFTGLGCLPLLSEVSLSFSISLLSVEWPLLFLQRLPQLRKLSISARPTMTAAWIEKLVEWTKLEELTLDNQERDDPMGLPDAVVILNFKPPTPWTLHLSGWALDINHSSLANIRYQLRSLHTLHVGGLSAESLETLWKHMIYECIYLKDIAISTINEDFINYLKGYEGLEKLSMTHLHFHDLFARVSAQLHAKFHAFALAKHTKSLQELTISSWDNMDWSVHEGDDTLYDSSILACRNLIKLSMSVCEIPAFKASHWPFKAESIIPMVLNMVAKLPKLKSLTLFDISTRWRKRHPRMADDLLDRLSMTSEDMRTMCKCCSLDIDNIRIRCTCSSVAAEAVRVRFQQAIMRWSCTERPERYDPQLELNFWPGPDVSYRIRRVTAKWRTPKLVFRPLLPPFTHPSASAETLLIDPVSPKKPLPDLPVRPVEKLGWKIFRMGYLIGYLSRGNKEGATKLG
ncbi:hypothetical protein C8J56DRAFT_8929 [Mycena floridula]|nr:hypothetical protein C8J56DRAFT_8929 [Mycena floridula]